MAALTLLTQPLIPSHQQLTSASLINVWVQAALGVPLNSSILAFDLALTFRETGDPARGGFVESPGALLDQGIGVTLMYGDRDYMCNWIGGENVSLAIPYSAASDFERDGY